MLSSNGEVSDCALFRVAKAEIAESVLLLLELGEEAEESIEVSDEGMRFAYQLLDQVDNQNEVCAFQGRVEEAGEEGEEETSRVG